MLGHVVRRLVLAVSMVWAISFGAFCAFGLSFDPTFSLALSTKESDREYRRQLIAQFHLHDPILDRYWLWLKSLPTNGFGHTVLWFGRSGAGRTTDTTIGPQLWPAVWTTAQLVAVALVLVVVLSVLVGTVSAQWPGSPLDVVLRAGAYVSWSVPTFVVGVLVWRWLGPKGWFELGTPGGGFVEWIRRMTLPAVTLSLGLVGVYSRYVRSALIVSLRQPYATVARGKGLPESRVLVRHALRNSLIPFVSAVSLDFAAIVGASLATDYVFDMGGLASLFLNALGGADPFELTAILVVLGAIVAVFMLVADLVLGWLDPRARIVAAP